MLESGETPKVKRGALFESVVLSAAAIAFGCVAFADFLNHTVKSNDNLAVAAAGKIIGGGASQAGARAGIDYSTTGAIVPLRQPPALNPCEKK